MRRLYSEVEIVSEIQFDMRVTMVLLYHRTYIHMQFRIAEIAFQKWLTSPLRIMSVVWYPVRDQLSPRVKILITSHSSAINPLK